jgi:hypothetical protein
MQNAWGSHYLQAFTRCLQVFVGSSQGVYTAVYRV